MLSGIFDDTDGGFDNTYEESEQLIGRTISFIIPKGAFVNSVFGQSLSRPSLLTMETSKELPFSDASILYSSLVARVDQESRFDEAVQDQAVELLKMLEPKPNERKLADSIIKDLVPSSTGSPSGFVECIVTLLSSPHSAIVTATFSLLHQTIFFSSAGILITLLEADLIPKILASIQPHTLPITGKNTVLHQLNKNFSLSLRLVRPDFQRTIISGFSVKISRFRPIALQKVVIPSSQFVAFLISKRFILHGELSGSFMELLAVLLEIGPLYRPTLEFVLASPIVMGFSSCLSSVDHCYDHWNSLDIIDVSLEEWKNYGPEVAQSGKRMTQSLFSEGFEDTLEQMLNCIMGDCYRLDLAIKCSKISIFLGSNVQYSSPPLW
ncbi:hypothetical protein BLNAU_7218 [Blattamonas nauphoetae]|uniref:Uncharacterized protein n=1 Tax=Blattamonas nauphoetae TaxID=2049346 RepID=A0ABQ9Y257_9EUKA|nr:hypothetical protein BLNAU_7218 [Blattamonas nauphoetae]